MPINNWGEPITRNQYVTFLINEFSDSVRNQISGSTTEGQGSLSQQRTEAMRRYFAAPYGNEDPDASYSTWVSTDTRDVLHKLQHTVSRALHSGAEIARCLPDGPDDVELAEVTTAWLNLWYNEHGGKERITDPMLFNGLLTKYAVIKTEWQVEDSFDDSRYIRLTETDYKMLIRKLDKKVRDRVIKKYEMLEHEEDTQTWEQEVINVMELRNVAMQILQEYGNNAEMQQLLADFIGQFESMNTAAVSAQGPEPFEMFEEQMMNVFGGKELYAALPKIKMRFTQKHISCMIREHTTKEYASANVLPPWEVYWSKNSIGFDEAVQIVHTYWVRKGDLINWYPKAYSMNQSDETTMWELAKQEYRDWDNDGDDDGVHDLTPEEQDWWASLKSDDLNTIVSNTEYRERYQYDQNFLVNEDSKYAESTTLADTWVRICEHYRYADFTGRNDLALYRVITVGNKVLDVRRVKRKPFRTFQPWPITHRFPGLGVWDLVHQNEAEKTTLTRLQTDQAKLNTYGMLEANAERLLYQDGRDLLDRTPGQWIRTTTDTQVVHAVQTPPVDFMGIANAISYFDHDTKRRTGVADQTQFRLPDTSLQKSTQLSTDSVMAILDADGIEHDNLVRQAATTIMWVMRDVYDLYRENSRDAQWAYVRNMYLQVEPWNFRERTKFMVSVGAGTFNSVARRNEAAAVLDTVRAVSMTQMMPGTEGAVSAVHLANAAKYVLKSIGIQDVDTYLGNGEVEKTPQQQMIEQATQEIALKKSQAELNKMEAEAEEKVANTQKIMAEAEGIGVELGLKQQDLQSQIKERTDKVELKRIEMDNEFYLGSNQLQLEFVANQMDMKDKNFSSGRGSDLTANV